MGKDKWVKLAAIANIFVALEVAIRDVIAFFSTTVGRPGSGQMNWIPLLVCAVLLYITLAMYKDKWPFHRKSSELQKAAEKAKSLAFRLLLERCQLLIKGYRRLSSIDPEHTKKPLSPEDSWHLLGENERWSYTELSLLRYAQDYSWLIETAKKAFAEMGWEPAPFFVEKPYYMTEVLAALEKFEDLLTKKVALLEERKDP
jgi:hypothetical protein